MSRTPWRILVADDDPTAALLFRAALSGEEFLLEIAADGDAALAAFRSQDFDMALLDVEMPGRDGIEVCVAIRQTHGADFPVILVTGRSDPAFIVRAQALAAGYVSKPLDWSSLPAMLRNLLAAPSS